eukprot:6175752-Pleurochrysis_carterae.AAC.1
MGTASSRLLLATSFCAPKPIKSGGGGSLPSETRCVGIDSSSTGLQSATGRSLIGGGCAGADGWLIVCTKRATSWSALRARLTAQRAASRSPCSLSLAQTEVLQVKIGGGAQKVASFDAVGARTPCHFPSAVFLPLGASGSQSRGNLLPKIFKFGYCDLGFPTVRGE